MDDYIGGGENVFSETDLNGEYDGQFLCFRDRILQQEESLRLLKV